MVLVSHVQLFENILKHFKNYTFFLLFFYILMLKFIYVFVFRKVK